MDRRTTERLPEGFGGVLVVDKPAGPTSHDVVARVRRLTGLARVGHTGTLDPFATGVLPLVLGRATRLARFMAGSSKAYVADLRLGVATDTDDVMGSPVSGPAPDPAMLPRHEQIEAALAGFRGPQSQRPPAFSAKKVEGTRAYRLARQDRAVELVPVPVEVFQLDLLEVAGDRVSLALDCSAGFYVRALARDLGTVCGCGAHVVALRRTRCGEFAIEEAVCLAGLEGGAEDLLARVIPIDRMLPWMPAAHLRAGAVERVGHGNPVTRDEVERWEEGSRPGGREVRLLGPGGRLLAIARHAEEGTGKGLLQPTVVLV